MAIISIIYLFIIVIYLLMGAAIIFHMLHYKINRRASLIMFAIYVAGGIFLLISNFILYKAVDWYQIFSSLNF